MEKKQIPNILSFFRLFLVPVYIWTFFAGPVEESAINGIDKRSLYCVLIYTAAGITDIIDGFLARRFNWITEMGKILDPLADKFMQCAVIVCLAVRVKFFVWIAVLFLLKELTMVAGASVILEKKKDIVVSSWYGKMSTSVFYATVIICVLFKPNQTITVLLGCTMVAAMLFALVMYYLKIFRGQYGIKHININENERK